MKKSIEDIFPIGQKVFFHSGNFTGYEGVVKSVDYQDPEAIFGFIINVELENGRIVKVEKSEHITKL